MPANAGAKHSQNCPTLWSTLKCWQTLVQRTLFILFRPELNSLENSKVPEGFKPEWQILETTILKGELVWTQRGPTPGPPKGSDENFNDGNSCDCCSQKLSWLWCQALSRLPQTHMDNLKYLQMLVRSTLKIVQLNDQLWIAGKP